MIKSKQNYLFIFLIFFIFIITTKNHKAAEILMYADDISYDSEENIIAKGNAKIIQKNKIIISELIIYSKKTDKIFLPLDFSLKDEKNNYYYGSNGFVEKNLDYWTIEDVKILLNDGSRIVGSQIKRDKNIDIITKAVYSPCKSKIKIANFICPIWQLEGEKMLHDYDSLFLYQKHSKMRLLNLPVFYSPYLVTPSPLRKERKSGFLTPSMNLNFFDAKTSQSISFPYYFNISQDKELTLTPTVNYGGGVDASQRFNFDYNQILSGGFLNSNLTFDSTFENDNNEEWLKEASLLNNFDKKLNEKFLLEFNSALQTSKNYIQKTNPNDDLSYSSSLNTSLNIKGYNIRKIDDKLRIGVSTYQSNQNDENNKVLPTIFPFVTYNTGKNYYKKYSYNNILEFYNIFRD
ncbi:MAG: hypothetical protein CMP16_04320, partial [Rickettsiales bacterium]|nr:hypothetical protein [Rickettsiales bacterium]